MCAETSDVAKHSSEVTDEILNCRIGFALPNHYFFAFNPSIEFDQ